MNPSKTDLTQGAIPKRTLFLALPVLIAMTVQTLYGLINLFFVGKLGATATAALSISLNAFFLVLTVSQVLGVGGMSLISQAWGAKNHERAREIFSTVILISFIFGLIMALLGHFLAEQYISFFTLDFETARLGVAYFKIYTLTFLLQCIMMVASFCLRGAGDFKTPTLIMIGAFALNMGLDPCLIYGLGPFPKLGVSGAAIASVISQSLACGIYLWLIFIGKRLALTLNLPLRCNLSILRQILQVGIPSGLQYLVLAALLMITYRWLRPLGSDVAAAVGIGFRLLHSSYLPMVSFAIATSSLVGQNYGARQLRRVRQAFSWGLIYTNIWALLITSLYWCFPYFFIGLFTEVPTVTAHATLYLRVFGLSNLLIASIFISTSLFQGLGRTLVPLSGAILKLLLFLTFWRLNSSSTNLYLIYGAGLAGVAVEMAWDLCYAKWVFKGEMWRS